MVRLAKITKNRLGAPVWAHILYFPLCQLYRQTLPNKELKPQT